MFKWLSQIKDWREDRQSIGSIKFILTKDKELACEIEVKKFDKLSSDYFSKLLFLLDQGQLTSVCVEALGMLHENNIAEQSTFVNDVLIKMQKEQSMLLQPIVKPTDVFKEG